LWYTFLPLPSVICLRSRAARGQAPDTFLADGSSAPVLWSHDTLPWDASFVGHNPPDATADFVTREVVPWAEYRETRSIH